LRLLWTLTMLLCCAAVPVFTPSLAGGAQPNGPKRLRLLFTTDTLGYLEPCG